MAFLTANARWIAGGFLFAFFSSFGQTFFISIWSAEIRAEFELSHGGFGGIYMAATLASAATLPFIGKIIDATTIRRFGAGVMVALAAFAVLMALAPGLWWLAVAIYGLRLFGQGLMTHTGQTAMGRWFAAGRGRAVSLATVGHQAGEALLPTVAVTLGFALGWRQTWLLFAVLIVGVALPAISWLTARERSPRSEAGDAIVEGRQWTREEVLRDPLFWALTGGIMLPPFTGTSIFFHQDYLIALNGWRPEFYYGAFAVMAATTTVFALLTGVAVDRFGATRLLPVFFVPLGVACLLLGSLTQEWAAVAFMFWLGVSYGISSTLFGALWPEVYGTKHLGAVRSVIVAMMVFFTAAGPGLTGLLIDWGVPFPTQLLVIGAYCFAVALPMLLVSRRLERRRSIELGLAAA